jgi:ABC-type Fe3+-hydroxamate transport system substrate-binding protein
MNKMVSVLLACIMVMTLVGCGGNSNKHEGEAKTPSGSSVQKGRDYHKVVDDFKSKGFKNIKTEKIEDLVTGWMTKDGEVKEVSVGGDVDYSADEWISADAEVIIKYHTFKKRDTESAEEPKAKDDSNVEKLKVEKPKVEILTVDNCKELAEILGTKDESDPLIKEFAQKYAGRTIEFDGNTAYVSNHGNYKTRFDYLIYAGDYSKTTFSGPNFQFRDVNYNDLNLTGDNVPDTFGVGLNIHIIATVEEYSETSGLFQLKPVSIKMR